MSLDVRAVTRELRVVPPVLVEIRRPQRMLERNLMVTRRAPLVVLSGFFEPLFYLLSIRVGLDSLVGDVTVGGTVVSYDAFVAPALMAASAMNGAVYDSTMNIFHKMKHQKLYDSVLSTPLGAGDVALGEIGWAMARGALYSLAFLVTMAALGLTSSWWAVLGVPACVLVGFAFAAIGMAGTTYMRSWSDAEYVPTLMLPLFLFSATFYPLSSYGDLGWIVQLSPLYHGVALVRGFNVGALEWSMFAHAGVLLGISAVGLTIAARRIRTLLLS